MGRFAAAYEDSPLAASFQQDRYTHELSKFMEYKVKVVEFLQKLLDTRYDQSQTSVSLEHRLEFVVTNEDLHEILADIRNTGIMPAFVRALFEYDKVVAPHNVFAEQLGHDSNIIRTKLR